MSNNIKDRLRRTENEYRSIPVVSRTTNKKRFTAREHQIKAIERVEKYIAAASTPQYPWLVATLVWKRSMQKTSTPMALEVTMIIIQPR